MSVLAPLDRHVSVADCFNPCIFLMQPDSTAFQFHETYWYIRLSNYPSLICRIMHANTERYHHTHGHAFLYFPFLSHSHPLSFWLSLPLITQRRSSPSPTHSIYRKAVVSEQWSSVEPTLAVSSSPVLVSFEALHTYIRAHYRRLSVKVILNYINPPNPEVCFGTFFLTYYVVKKVMTNLTNVTTAAVEVKDISTKTIQRTRDQPTTK